MRNLYLVGVAVLLAGSICGPATAGDIRTDVAEAERQLRARRETRALQTRVRDRAEEAIRKSSLGKEMRRQLRDGMARVAAIDERMLSPMTEEERRAAVRELEGLKARALQTMDDYKALYRTLFQKFLKEEMEGK